MWILPGASRLPDRLTVYPFRGGEPFSSRVEAPGNEGPAIAPGDGGSELKVTIIGVDCATQPERTGLARAEWEDGWQSDLTALVCKKNTQVEERIAAWLPAQGPTLLALDAPLGWPAAFKQILGAHQAGDALPEPEINRFFRRATDQFVHRTLGKRPLDVGAERIARTAYRVLNLLQSLRQLTGRAIPLAWEPALPDGISAIEVYPAGTLKAWGAAYQRYKKKSQLQARHKILMGLQELLPPIAEPSVLEGNADSLDAAICVLAGADFLQGEVYQPAEAGGPGLLLAQNEGWIWVRKSSPRQKALFPSEEADA